MEKERKITAPDGCEIEKVELVDGVAVVTFRDKERQLPKSWEEFCENNDIKDKEAHIGTHSIIFSFEPSTKRDKINNKDVLPNRATAEAVLALCQLIQLRDCYNGDWVPDWEQNFEEKYFINLFEGRFDISADNLSAKSPLFFKTRELRNEFLRNFRDLINKLKPLYGIKEGGEK